jgi:hypothetical protein
MIQIGVFSCLQDVLSLQESGKGLFQFTVKESNFKRQNLKVCEGKQDISRFIVNEEKKRS